MFCQSESKFYQGFTVYIISTYLGLQLWVNMEPYSRQLYGTVHTPYTLGISRKNDQMDQKTFMFNLVPGKHVSINVLPKIVDASDEFRMLPLTTRKCKLPHETQGFNFLNEYTRKGCELECAVQKAASFCKCLPWYYPNNFTALPICDMFGSHCFDRVTSDESFYKKCQIWCREECHEMALTMWRTVIPLGMIHN